MLPASSPLPSDFAAAYNGALARVSTMRLDVRWFPSVSSTMDLAGEAVQAGAAEGTVFCADEQTAGRGRRGRAWSSPAAAGLYFSMVLRPVHDHAADNQLLSLITLAAGVAIRVAIMRATGLNCELKWPNDVVVERRKLAGILAEGFAVGTPEQAVVLGVGINVARASHSPDVEPRAVSLAGELGTGVDRAALFEEALVALAEWYDRLRRGNADDILRAWRQGAPSAVGALIEVVEDGRRGTTAGIDDSGALLMTTRDGVDRIVSGELRWL